MAKKLNLSGVKEFLFNHGEKVALGACAFIAIVLGGMRLLEASGANQADGAAGKTWAQALNDIRNSLSQQAANPTIKPFDKKSIEPISYRWDPVETKYLVTFPYAPVGERDDTKRRNPTALKISEDPRNIRMDYVRSLILVNDYDAKERTLQGVVSAGADGGEPGPGPMGSPKKGKGIGMQGPADAGATMPDRLKKGRAQNFVVVHAVFPMKLQVEEFRKALKFTTQKELFDLPREDLPKVKGINVVRFELTRIGGEVVDTTQLVFFDGKLKMQAALETLLRDSMYDETLLPVFEPYLYNGLAMPLPQLAYGRYPKFQFPGWDLAWDDGEVPAKKGGMDKPQPPMGGKNPGITVPGEKKGGGKGGGKIPMPGGGGEPGAAGSGVELKEKQITEKEVRDADKTLANRLFGDPENKKRILDTDFNPFHVLGQFPPEPDESAPPAGGNQPMGPRAGGLGGMKPADGSKYFDAWDVDPPNGGKAGGAGPMPPGLGPNPSPKKDKGGKMPKDAPGQPSYAAWERDAVVRFVDPDVKPGKTYAYAIQVRIANPNFGKNAKVAFDFLATVPELQDNTSWVTTPSITIPQDYFLYAMDQHQYDRFINPPAKENKEAEKAYATSPQETTFQIHQWLGEKSDQDTRNLEEKKYMIGAWMVLDRKVVRKGERIGGTEKMVFFPAWRPLAEAFAIPKTPGDVKKKVPAHLGVAIKLKDDAPVLVDFAGGKKMKSNNAVEEETALDVLILTPDGKLRVHNSRDDSDALQPLAEVQGLPPPAISRQDRYLQTQRRLNETLNATAPVAPPTKK